MRIILWIIIAVILPGMARGANTIPTRAIPLLSVLGAVLDTDWPTLAHREVPAGQIEQESAWKQYAERKDPKNHNEYGFGLTQITITDNFNNFIEAKRVTKMKNLSWNDRFDAKFQLKYLILSDKSNFTFARIYFDDEESQLAGMLVCYNGGPGTLVHRKAAALKQGIKPPRTWFNGMDSVFAGYEQRKFLGSTLGKTRNEYPRVIIKIRSPKYKGRI